MDDQIWICATALTPNKLLMDLIGQIFVSRWLLGGYQSQILQYPRKGGIQYIE